MTRDQLLAKAHTLIEQSCADHQTRLVIDMALRGVAPQQILDAYLCAIDWNEQALIDGLKQVEQILDAEIQRHAAGGNER